jgi:transcriptional regulator GlxA family with amidase domain
MRIAKRHRVAVLAYDGMGPFKFGVVVEVFGLSRPELDVHRWYTLEVCSETPGRPLRAMRWLISQRVAASLPLLETPHLPVEKVAEAVGFESPVTFRHHFTKAMRTSPSSYRRAFHTASSGTMTRPRRRVSVDDDTNRISGDESDRHSPGGRVLGKGAWICCLA